MQIERCNNHLLRYPTIKHDKNKFHEKKNTNKKVSLKDQSYFDTMLK